MVLPSVACVRARSGGWPITQAGEGDDLICFHGEHKNRDYFGSVSNLTKENTHAFSSANPVLSRVQDGTHACTEREREQHRGALQSIRHN